MPSSLSSSFADRRASLRRRPTRSSGSSTFSTADSVGTRLKNWNTKPTLRRRRRASSVSLNPSMRSPSSQTSPAVGRSSPARRLSSVDFPHPLGPMIATNSPRSIADVDAAKTQHLRAAGLVRLRELPRLEYRCHQTSSFSASRCSISSSHSRSAFRCKIAPSTRSSAAGPFPFASSSAFRSRSDCRYSRRCPSRSCFGSASLRRRDDDELHEELVLQPPARDRRLDPGRERSPARLGQLVHALAAAVARHRLTNDEAIPLEPPERHVDLTGVQRRQQIAELLLQRLLQLIPVSARRR